MSHKMEMVLASCMFVLIVVIGLLMQRIPGEKITEETVETQPIELISGMPCEMLLEVIELNTGSAHEQKTSEEERIGVVEELQVAPSDFREAEPMPTTEVVAYTAETSCEVQVLPAVSTEAEPIPTVTEATAQPDLHEYLMAVLTEHNIQHWYLYACCQIQQESGWNPYAENKNGLDKGLLQYRITYYPGANIFDPYEQIRIYVGQVANRLNAGLSVEETISRHYTSDYVTEINWDYVNAVLNCLK